MIVENKPEKRKKNPSNSGCKNCLTGSSISYAEAFLDVIALQQQSGLVIPATKSDIVEKLK